jgi:hypothetical protein
MKPFEIINRVITYMVVTGALHFGIRAIGVVGC